jgi:hypothetical protein
MVATNSVGFSMDRQWAQSGSTMSGDGISRLAAAYEALVAFLHTAYAG